MISPGDPLDTHRALFTASEIEDERLRVLRRRITVFTIVIGCLVLALAAVTAIVVALPEGADFTVIRSTRLGGQVLLGILIMVVPWLRRKALAQMGLQSLLRRASLVIILATLAQFSGAEAMATALNEVLFELDINAELKGPEVLAGIFLVLHVATSIVVPWTVQEALRPAVALVLIANVVLVVERAPAGAWYIVNVFVVLAVLPGLAIAWIRTGRTTEYLLLRLISGRYDEMRRELAAARRIHERLFPAPIDTPVHVRFHYEPADELGGDFLGIAQLHDGGVIVLVIDVTGHGIPAALAVNRLNGELKRITGRDTHVTPGDVLAALNEYILLTLAEDRLLATAIAVRIDPGAATIAYSSAGHPPALLIGADGTVRRLDSTTVILGVIDNAAYGNGNVDVPIRRGDRLLLFTDGAFERRDRHGRMLDLDGFEAMVQRCATTAGMPTEEAFLERLERTINDFRAGAPDDDTLLVLVEPGHENDAT